MGISCRLGACAGSAYNCYTVVCVYIYIYKGHLQKTSFSDSTEPIKHRNASVAWMPLPRMGYQRRGSQPCDSRSNCLPQHHWWSWNMLELFFTNQTPKAFWECTRWFQIGNGLILRGGSMLAVLACGSWDHVISLMRLGIPMGLREQFLLTL